MRPDRLAAVLLVGLIAGCGTLKNHTDGWKGRTVPYGGVRIAADEFVNLYDVEGANALVLWPLWAADIGLSAVGDTLTLPLAWAALAGHGFRDAFLPPIRAAEPPPPVSPASSSPSTPGHSPATPSAGR
ncbi:MAG: YceK/YidQ family lipoprotein [Gemmataceae bacterium]|nr:YceK/YidQ family lipoprotein [Gemmataceae bacterium]